MNSKRWLIILAMPDDYSLLSAGKTGTKNLHVFIMLRWDVFERIEEEKEETKSG